MEERELSCTNGYYTDLSQKAEKQSPALMVGIKIGAATMENSMEFLSKIKNRTTIWSGNAISGYYLKKLKALLWKYICTLVFIAALFIIDKMWKQSIDAYQ